MNLGQDSWLWTLIIGLIVGGIAKLLVPGKDPGGCIITTLLGIAGAYVGYGIKYAFGFRDAYVGWILSIVGAVILLLVYRAVVKRT